MKQVYLLLFFCLMCVVGWGQIAIQDFDTGNTWSFSSDVAFFDNGSDGFFGITSSLGTLGTGLTDNFLGVRDLDDEGDNGTGGDATITFSAVNVSAYSSISVSFNYDVDGFDTGDNVQYQILINGVGQGIVNIVSSGSPSSTDGTINEAIPDGTTTVGLQLILNQNGGSDYAGFDEFQITGTIGATPQVGFDNATSTENESNVTQNINVPVTASNFSSNFTLSVTATGGTAEGGDYTLNTSSLNFTGNGTQNVSISIHDDADTDDETIELTIAETTATGVTITTAVHTMTIIDDETPPTPEVYITEIMYNTPSTDDEWIELYNASVSSQDVSGWDLVYNGSTFTFPGSSSIPAQSYVVIAVGSNGDGSFNNDNPFTPSFNDLGVANSSVASTNNTNNLGNSTASILLRDGSDVTVDQVTYDDGDASSTDGNGSSYEIVSILADNSSTSSNWQASVSNGGTPGAASSVLPITLMSFNGQRINSAVYLHWRTSTEINNDYMSIERSNDGRIFEEIGRVQGAGTTQVEQSYSFVDERPLPGVNYYRLRQVDFDGRYEYHETVAVDFSSETTGKLLVYPTQAKDRLQVVAGTEMNEDAQVQVLSADGKIWKTTLWLEKSTQMELSVTELPAGSYWLRVLDGKRVEQAYFQKI